MRTIFMKAGFFRGFRAFVPSFGLWMRTIFTQMFTKAGVFSFFSLSFGLWMWTIFTKAGLFPGCLNLIIIIIKGHSLRRACLQPATEFK